MELWVRTQDKRRLLKPTDIGLGLYCGKYNVYDCEKSMGEYATEERCYEIIDEIQWLLINNGRENDHIAQMLSGVENKFIVYEMPQE